MLKKIFSCKFSSTRHLTFLKNTVGAKGHSWLVQESRIKYYLSIRGNAYSSIYFISEFLQPSRFILPFFCLCCGEVRNCFAASRTDVSFIFTTILFHICVLERNY